MGNSNLRESYGTLSETVNGLKKAGYYLDLNIKDECLVCHQTNTTLSPQDFQIDKIYRFEGTSDPDDQAIVYAISSARFGIKGLLVNGYGIYADESTSALVAKLRTHEGHAGMEISSNEATPKRPDGNHTLNTPMATMNLDQLIAQIKSEITWKERDHNAITIFKSEAMRIVLIGLNKDAALKPHKANGVISVQVLEGKIQFITDYQTSVIDKGEMIALQENITHSVLALSEAFFLLTLAINKV